MAKQMNVVPSKAAIVVVHPVAGVGDATTIQDGIDLLPAEGGTVIVREGTYVIVAQIVLPDKHVVIRGAGESTVLSYTYGGALFYDNFNKGRSFSDLTITGNDSAGQICFDVGAGQACGYDYFVDRVVITNVRKMVRVDAAGYLCASFTNSNWQGVGGADYIWWDGPGYAVFRKCYIISAAGYGGTLNTAGNSSGFAVSDSSIGVRNGATFDYIDIVNSYVTGNPAAGEGVLSIPGVGGGLSKILGTLFNGCSLSVGGLCSIIGNQFLTASMARSLDVISTAGATIVGNDFSVYTTEAVRIAASNCNVVGNRNCKVTETGGANNNYIDNPDASYTLIGARSRSSKNNYRNVRDFGAVGDGLTNDAPAINLAVAALPVSGGVVFFPPGQYAVVTTITQPDKSVSFIGSGVEATVIAPVGGIAAFTIAFDREFLARDFRINGVGAAGTQRGFTSNVVAGYGSKRLLQRVMLHNLDTGIEITGAGYEFMELDNVDIFAKDDVTSRHIKGAGQFDCLFCNFASMVLDRGGFETTALSLDVYAYQCSFNLLNSGTFGELRAVGCWFGANTVTSIITMGSGGIGGRLWLADCTFQQFGGSVTRCVDIGASVESVKINNCAFANFTNEAVRTAGNNGIFNGNQNCKVLETGAANLNYLDNPDATYTLIGGRSRSSKNNYRNVRDFGATGDGATNDQAAIQAAIDALPAAGGVVYFPPGNYLINTTLTLPNKPCTLQGAGPDASRINIGANAIVAVTAGFDQWVKISGLMFQGFGVAGQTGISFAFASGYLNDFLIDFCYFYNLDFGLNTPSGGGHYPHIRVQNCNMELRSNTTSRYIRGNGQFEIYGGSYYNLGAFGAIGPNVADYPDLYIYDGCQIASPDGIQCNDCVIHEAIIVGGTITAAAGGSGNVTISNSKFLGAPDVVRKLDIGAAAVRVVIVGNHFEAWTSEAIRTAVTGGAVITDNRNCKVVETGAANLTYLDNPDAAYTLTGARSRSSKNNYRNVRDFGAVGDGATNDQAAIQAAIDALPTNGGTVYFPPGSYKINTTLTIINHIRLIGSGRSSATIKLGASAIRAFSVTADKAISFEHLKIEGGSVASQAGVYLAYDASYSYSVDLIDVWVKDVNFGVELNAANYPFLRILNSEIATYTDASSRSIKGPGEIHLNDSSINYGVSGDPDLTISGNCFIHASNGVVVGSIRMSESQLFDGLLTVTGGLCNISQCNFYMSAGTITRWVDITAAAAVVSIVGSMFDSWTSDAIRITSTLASIVGNRNCRVTENGTNQSNRYDSNDGFTSSTFGTGSTSKVDNQFALNTTTTPLTLTDTHRTVLMDATAGNKTINLPAAATCKNRIYTIKKIDASANTVTIDGDGAETIDDATTLVISTQYASYTIQSDGVEWWVL